MAATLQFNYTGGASNSTPSNSLGGAHSSHKLSATALNNLFSDVTPDVAVSGGTDYRAFDVTNVGNAASASTKFYLSEDLKGASDSAYSDNTIKFGIESSATNSTTSIADATTAPSGVTFAAYDTNGKLSLPAISSGDYVRVWVRRTISSGAANDANIHTVLAVEYA